MEATVQRQQDHMQYFIPQKDLELGRVAGEEQVVVGTLDQGGVEMAWLLLGNLMARYLRPWSMEVPGDMETIMVSSIKFSTSEDLLDLPSIEFLFTLAYLIEFLALHLISCKSFCSSVKKVCYILFITLIHINTHLHIYNTHLCHLGDSDICR